MIANPHKAIVLKMSYVTCCRLLSALSYSLKYLRAFYGTESHEYCDAFTLYNIVADVCSNDDLSKQAVCCIHSSQFNGSYQ